MAYRTSLIQDDWRDPVTGNYDTTTDEQLDGSYISCPWVVGNLERGAVVVLDVSPGVLAADIVVEGATDQELTNWATVVTTGPEMARQFPRRPVAMHYAWRAKIENYSINPAYAGASIDIWLENR